MTNTIKYVMKQLVNLVCFTFFSVFSLLSVDLLQHTLTPEHRAAAQEDAGIRCGVKHHLFPENFDRLTSVKADLSIPSLHETVNEEVRTWSNPNPDHAECSFYL